MPTGASDPRLKTAARRRLREQVAKQRGPCAACGGPIDYDAPAGDPLAYELDERLPRYLGGNPLDPANVQPKHARCNRRGGAEITNRIRGRTPRLTPVEADEW